eukprot:TRINITY_DN5233_c0_g8_i1.p1 TRINITY_DN5233_c0_g8~~TRINITY_DN5233_c0_g8_i1.p1  ORF type:complete len:394 (+),score=87.29 TRINITY_DN5233_c0_g8_i1:64-1182(+)
MSSRTFRSRVVYLALGLAGAKYAHYKHGPETKDAKFSDFPDLEDHHNIMAKVLTKRMYDSYKRLMSPSKFTLDNCIQVGVDIKGSGLGRKGTGLVAGDLECYEVFGDLFDGVMSEVFKKQDHKKSLHSCKEVEYALDGRFVKEVTARCYRNLKEFPFTPALTRGQRRHVEQLIVPHLPTSGTYSPIAAIQPSLYTNLAQTGIVFTKPSSEQDRVSGLTRDWPDARGLYVANDRSLSAWVNGRHHLELTSYEKGPDLGKAVRRLATAATDLEASLPVKFQWTEKHGYAGHDLPELGSALSLEATVHLPKLCTDYGFLRKLTDLGLRPLTHPDEHLGTWKVASQPSFDTEVEHVKKFADAIQKLVDAEKELHGK